MSVYDWGALSFLLGALALGGVGFYLVRQAPPPGR
jgi:hypothetical protein